ncbi:MAG: peptidase C69 [Bacteroidetes bacterium GWE2_29_8]|nr:MAG: peptidase C69 [Bacteroidetes bacterium GWE2_29_8]OFY23771.1 MAG: peptidase C69 [Bacteroidetes bacterium GWF2_29_10]
MKQKKIIDYATWQNQTFNWGKKLFVFAFLFIISFNTKVQSCTNLLVTKGASKDGSTMITYSADSHVLYGELYYRPAASYPEGVMRDIYEWDTGKYLGKIKQATQTYSVVGNINEYQVAIGETTYGGRDELQNPEGIMDYGSLIYVTLQRAKTAREAIKIMEELVNEYGYYSSGESFSISDPNEVWYMEIIGKGPKSKGANWIALKVPDGYISGHANQARIRQISLNDKENCLYDPNMIAFAKEKGYFKGDDKNFSFADAFAPLTYGALRFSEARVWSMFRRAAPSLNIPIDFVKGVDGASPMPLWIKPDKKLSVHDVMQLMRDHYEGTEFDMTKDLGAGPYSLPYRWRPLTWKVDSIEYLNERAISTQQTGFSFVTQSRSWLPNPIGGIIWFGVDDTYSTCYVPMYCGIRKVPYSFAEGTGSFHQFSWDAAFWVFNFVANFAYSRYSDMIVDVQKVQYELEGSFFSMQPEIEKKADALYKISPEMAREYLTEYSVAQGDMVTKRWMKLGESLLFKYLDGNVKDEYGKPKHIGYPEQWRKRIADDTGDHLKMKKLKNEAPSSH